MLLILCLALFLFPAVALMARAAGFFPARIVQPQPLPARTGFTPRVQSPPGHAPWADESPAVSFVPLR